MNSRQQRTLRALLEMPTRSDIRWADIESLLRALGADVSERAGSRLAVMLHGVRAIFHRPQPRPTTNRARCGRCAAS
jgi:hypothetical protein